MRPLYQFAWGGDNAGGRATIQPCTALTAGAEKLEVRPIEHNGRR